MKKFGFGKKTEGENDDRSRPGLFGRKKPAPQDDNPYAQQPAEDPYARMTPYQQAKANLAAGPQGPSPGAVGLPSGPGAGLPSGPTPRIGYGTPPPSYHGSSQVGGGYAPDKFGAAGGYGNNRYDSAATAYGDFRSSSALPSQRFPSRGPGGYGGLGSDGDDRNREDLLAGARIRPLNPPSYPGIDNTASGVPDANDKSYGGGYGEKRELTAEEQEDQEYHSIVDEGKQMKRDGLASLQRTKQLAYQTLEVATGTAVRLGEQEDRLSNTEKNLDMAHAQHSIAVDKTKELKTVTRSMFAPHFSNPITKKKREAQFNEAVLARHREEREMAEATRREAYRGNQETERDFRDAMAYGDNRPKPAIPTAAQVAARRKQLMFDENDEEEQQLEEDIDNELDEVSDIAYKLKGIAVMQSKQLDRQAKTIDRMDQKSTGLGEGLAQTRRQLDRIH